MCLLGLPVPEYWLQRYWRNRHCRVCCGVVGRLRVELDDLCVCVPTHVNLLAPGCANVLVTRATHSDEVPDYCVCVCMCMCKQQSPHLSIQQ